MSNTKYLEAAASLGARLCREAIWSGDQCNWLGDSMEFIESSWQVVQRTFGPELYNGTSGIALFLARLFACTQEESLRKTAEGAVECALSQIDQLDFEVRFAFYTGLMGTAYALLETGEILGNEPFAQLGQAIVEKFSLQEPASQQSWDVVSGSGGIIPVLLHLHRRYGKASLLESALRHGDGLLHAAVPSEEGWSWETVPDPERRNLTGFSHGVAGIAWSLAELYRETKEQRFLHTAQEAFRYERRWFDPQQENWPDFRVVDENGGSIYAAAWCHGAPGIGLSRLRCYQILQDRECLAEAEAAIRTTSATLNRAACSGEGNYSLCHGNFGNAELLVAAHDLLGDKESLKIVQQLADDAMEKYVVGGNPWPCGVLNGGETPNLMLGLAGIGYFYLRLHDREKAPSVLLVH